MSKRGRAGVGERGNEEERHEKMRALRPFWIDRCASVSSNPFPTDTETLLRLILRGERKMDVVKSHVMSSLRGGCWV